MQPICLGSAQFLEASSKWVVGILGLLCLLCSVKLFFSLPPLKDLLSLLGGVFASKPVD